jgi:multiple sugar transport system substrate-binding protein
VLWTSEIHADRLAGIRYLADVFAATHPGVEVRVESVDENELHERTLRAVEEGDQPDLVNTSAQLLTSLGKRGILDLGEATRAIERIGGERFYAGALRRLAVPGGEGYYAVPLHGWVQGIWYRADWFEEAGLAPPSTWAAIRTAAHRFTDPARGTYGILLGTGGTSYSEQIFTQLALSNGADMFDSRGEPDFNTPAMAETLELYVELAGCTPKGPQTWRARDYYLQGRAAMLFYSTFIMDDLALEGAAEDSLGQGHFPDLPGAPFDPELARNTRLAPLITHARSAGYGVVNGLGVVRGSSREKREAVRSLLDFLYSPAAYVEWVHLAPGGMLPVLRDVAASDAFMRDPLGVFRRYGRPKMREILSGLERMADFGQNGRADGTLAAEIYARAIIPRMIRMATQEGVAVPQALAWAHGEMRRVAAENR